jgi:CMP-N-acetylneuraminic acid synthetase
VVTGGALRRLAIIPARGGSKRLPRKNLLDFLGRPMFAYSVAAAHESALFDRVLVSTDDAEIADAARGFGAEVRDRPQALAGDGATVEEVCLHVLGEEEAAGRRYDQFACLYATAPLRTGEDVRAVVGLIEAGRHDFAMAVTQYGLSPLLALRPTADGELEPLWPEMIHGGMRRHRGLLVSNGSTYAATVSAFRRLRTFYGPGLRGHVMPAERSTDINTADDLDLALWKARRAGLRGEQ